MHLFNEYKNRRNGIQFKIKNVTVFAIVWKMLWLDNTFLVLRFRHLFIFIFYYTMVLLLWPEKG